MKLTTIALLAAAVAADAQTLKVMSYNVRYPSPDDGPNLWEKRRDLFIESIRMHDPDLIGTQELFKLQGDYMVEKLPAYAWFGTSRRGNDQDEHMGIFYKKDRFRLIEQGQFWLSDSPETPGSQSWNMSLPRMVTWGLFERDGKRFYLWNTHFAHRREDEEARLKSARLIVERLAKVDRSIPLIFTGDFNAPAGGPVHEVMLAGGLKDSRTLAASPRGPEGTAHGFSGKAGNRRIDWILVSPGVTVKSNETITFARDGLFPSDHFPVIAEISLP
jgi:endonuclease/exonuclease/phosphatase family metal-dependent hydrolase